MKNIYGTTSAKLDPEAGTLVCSAPDVGLNSRNILETQANPKKQRCSGIGVENITVTVPSEKPPVYECRNMDNSLLQLTCIEESADEDRDTSQG